MSAVDTALFSGGVSRRLGGPDLDLMAPWPDFVAVLDEAKAHDDVEFYVTAWLFASDAHGGGASLYWRNDDAADDPGAVMSGYATDRHEFERRRRWDALQDHWQDVEHFDIEIRRELRRRGRFIDNRRTSLLEIKAVVRAFIATGGRLMIPPVGAAKRREPIEAAPDTRRFLTGAWSEADSVSARAMCRVAQRYGAQPQLERIVRALGQIENGWIVLGKEES